MKNFCSLNNSELLMQSIDYVCEEIDMHISLRGMSQWKIASQAKMEKRSNLTKCEMDKKNKKKRKKEKKKHKRSEHKNNAKLK